LFGQTFEPHDLIIIGVLVVLEGVLSIDNALVLGLLARRLPRRLQPRALSYGLIGALIFRVIAIVTAGYLLHWELPKLLGGLYLLYVAGKHFVFGSPSSPDHHDAAAAHVAEMSPQAKEQLAEQLSHGAGTSSPAAATIEPQAAQQAPPAKPLTTHSRMFWTTVGVIELTDIAFAVDSIVAAVGLVAPDPHPGHRFHPKLWLVIVGGMLGVIVMRFAAAMFIRLLEKFPRFETAAYLLVIVIGGKLIIDYLVPPIDFHDPRQAAFWVFWGLMAAAFGVGFIPHHSEPATPA
jgi:YkoY family integral membrane protein